VKATEVEIAAVRHFNPRANIIVPNVSWGLFHDGMEVDLLVVHNSGYATEVEIKVNGGDIKRDLKKRRHLFEKFYSGRESMDKGLIRRKYFAVPGKLAGHPDIPQGVGILAVDEDEYQAKIIRPAPVNKNARRLTPDEIYKLLELGCMRIWTLKEALITAKERKQIQPQTGEDKS
jgi:hypothetical protein